MFKIRNRSPAGPAEAKSSAILRAAPVELGLTGWEDLSMTTGTATAASIVPPHAQLIQMCAGGWVAAAVYAAAKLGLADHLANGTRTADELSAQTGTHAPSLYRFLRTLANFGIVTEGDAHRFALTPLGEALRT